MGKLLLGSKEGGQGSRYGEEDRGEVEKKERKSVLMLGEREMQRRREREGRNAWILKRRASGAREGSSAQGRGWIARQGLRDAGRMGEPGDKVYFGM